MAQGGMLVLKGVVTRIHPTINLENEKPRSAYLGGAATGGGAVGSSGLPTAAVGGWSLDRTPLPAGVCAMLRPRAVSRPLPATVRPQGGGKDDEEPLKNARRDLLEKVDTG